MVERLLHRLRTELGGPESAASDSPSGSHNISMMRSALARTPRVRFLSEQSGEVETHLKQVWAAYFRLRPDVLAAYLASVRFPDEDASTVALCLRAGREGRELLVEQVSQVFREMFHPEETLSLIFLSEDEESMLGLVAAPFYEVRSYGAEMAAAAQSGGLSFPYAPYGSSLEAARMFRAGDGDPLRPAG